MSKIDEVKAALAKLRTVAGRATAHISSVDDTSQLDEVLVTIRDITQQLQGTLPPEDPATEPDAPTTAVD